MVDEDFVLHIWSMLIDVELINYLIDRNLEPL